MSKIRSLNSSLCILLLAGFSTFAFGQETSEVELTGANRSPFPKAPELIAGPLKNETLRDLQILTRSFKASDITTHVEAIKRLGDSADPRVAWVFSDLLRVSRDAGYSRLITASAEKLISTKVVRSNRWQSLTDHLIAWDIPAFDQYLAVKRDIYTQIVPEWKRLMSDQGLVDWRHVSWGGVGIDNRPYDKTDLFIDSIPAVDNPKVSGTFVGRWLNNDAPVFGVVINGEARAYPRFIMEIREMVNDSLGGRDFAMPYCTLCGAAHVWFTDRVPEGVQRPVLRTSGLLIRSNKLMYDVVSGSVFDTFQGKATNGVLYKKGITLPGHSVVSTTWGEWKKAHPKTTVLAKQEALGRSSDLRKTRDANGPIFPVGDVDPRLAVQEPVLGVISKAGKPVAFHVGNAKLLLRRGEKVSFAGITIRESSGGLLAFAEDDSPLVAHESFWFGWSQFRPSTQLWTKDSSH